MVVVVISQFEISSNHDIFLVICVQSIISPSDEVLL